MRVIGLLLKCLLGMLLALSACLGFLLIFTLFGSQVKLQFRLYPFQNYRKIENYGQMLFYDRDTLYRRSFLGLGKVCTDPEWFLPYSDNMVWYGADCRKIYVWSMYQGIQCVDTEDYTAEEILSTADLEKTGAIHEISGISGARFCRDWNNGEGFTYWLDGTVYCYDYGIKEVHDIGTSQGNYGLTEQGYFYLEKYGEEQRRLMRKDSGTREAEVVASDVWTFDISSSGRLILYYDRADSRYHLYRTQSREDQVLATDEEISDPVISPDEAYILYQQIEFQSGMTDDEYCFYKVMNLDTCEVTTIYKGYREWLGYIW